MRSRGDCRTSGLGCTLRVRAFLATLGCLALLLSGNPTAHAADVPLGTDTFPCPDDLRPRTEFWLRIFSEFGRTEKVLHDNRYPWIIYEVIDVYGLDRDQAKDKEKIRIAYYEQTLDDMATKPAAQFSKDQKRIAALLSSIPDEARFTRAKDRLRTQTGIRENFEAGLRRSGRYLGFIHQELAEAGVPAEIAFLPHVESSFNASIRSHAGAVGLWQFTRGAGRNYMTIESDIDERRDPYAATRAAANYLKNSHNKLGSWPLAVVSYNYGLAGVRRAMNQLRTDDISAVLHGYDGPRFGFASQNFYCEFLAAIEIGRNPERYFPDLVLDPTEFPMEFRLDQYVKMSTLADAMGISLEEMKSWNPALGSSYVKGDRWIPKGHVVRLPMNINSPGELFATIPLEDRRDRPPTPRGHKVVRGDTLSKIAQRYRVSLAELRAANGIHNQDRIFPGQVLVLP